MHHANLLIGSREWAFTQIPEEERTAGPDTILLSYERMTIADARALIHDAQMRPIVRPYRTFIVDCLAILPEAQNTLLKLLEEPDANAHFFLIIPREDALLPTLRSRLNLLAIEHATIDTADFDAFHAMPYADRLACIAAKIEDEDFAWVRSFLQGAASYAARTGDAALIRDVLMTESYITAHGSSKKMLLEHLALSLPSQVG